MKKWWRSKSRYYQDFIKKTCTTWVLTAGVMSLVLTVDNPLTFFALVIIGIYATYEFYKQWQLDEMTTNFHRIIQEARDNLCETCPYHAVGEIRLECYKKGSQGEGTCVLPLPEIHRDDRVVSSLKTD